MQSIIPTKPITKKDLANPHLIKEINDEYKIKFLDKYVKMIIGRIYCSVISNHLDKLKVYKYDINTRGNLNLLAQLNSIFSGVDHTIYSPYPHPHLISPGDIPPFPVNYTDRFTADDSNKVLDRIIAGLRELFPDCLIQIDPMKTYILIDWN